MKIAIGCDHGGFEIKNMLLEHLSKRGIECEDFGIYELATADYPDIAELVAKAVVSGKCDRGILICGTGIGMSISANKIKGIRAAVCSDHYSVKYTRLHNNTNILCMGGRVIGPGTACELTDLFVDTEFSCNERHQKRIDKITDLENKYNADN